MVRRGAELLFSRWRSPTASGPPSHRRAHSAFGPAPTALTATGAGNIVSVLRELASAAEPLGVTLGLEICNRYETNVVNTAQDCLRLADDIGTTT